MVFCGEHSQTDPSAEEICWHTQLLPLHCLKTLPGFVCRSQARLSSLLLSLVGIGLMPRWGQGAGPQSKCCGCCCRKFARCFLCPCPPTSRVPFECSSPHCASFSISYVPTETQAHTFLQLLCRAIALPGVPKNPQIAPTKAVVSRLTTWQHRLDFQLGILKIRVFSWRHSWPWPNLSKEPTEINKTFMNCTLSAVNLPGNPPQQLIISKLTHCAAQQFSLAFQKWTDCSSLAPGDVSIALQNFFLETPF